MKRCVFSTMVMFTVCGLLAAQDPGGEAPPDAKPAFGDKDEAVIQNQRLLKIRNDTKSTLTVSIQYHTYDKGAWAWSPADPAASTEALSLDIEAGQELLVKNDNEPVAASRMRIWATSETQKWMQYKTKHTWLVPERDDNGEHIYVAEAMETFTFAFTGGKIADDPSGDPNLNGESCIPDGEVPPGDIPDWDIIPGGGFPGGGGIALVKDLAVLPVNVTGTNAMVKVINLGHLSANLGRRLMVQKIVPGSLPVDQGPIGPLFHYSVKTFHLVGLAPGAYKAFVSPGDDAPYHGNDKKLFTVASVAYSDLAALPVFVSGGNVTVKVKNVGTEPAAAGTHLKVIKLVPGAVAVDHGPVGALAVNGIKTFVPFALPAGTYKAYLTPGDAAPHHGNDEKTFLVLAGSFADLNVLPVLVAGGNVHIKVKNIGTAAAIAGQHLKVIKLAPGAVAVDHGPIGALGVGGVKSFPAFALPAGGYKAYITPGDAPPHHANDDDIFSVVAVPSPDLEVSLPIKSGGMVKATIKNNGPGAFVLGARVWELEKWNGVSWVAIPTVGSHLIPALAPGAVHHVQGTFSGAGNYRISITPADSVPANDHKTKMLP